MCLREFVTRRRLWFWREADSRDDRRSPGCQDGEKRLEMNLSFKTVGERRRCGRGGGDDGDGGGCGGATRGKCVVGNVPLVGGGAAEKRQSH